ncbi:hypothetical protein PsYK624_099410 [Phanerochaete sordida]|uniref:Uncharacterized protein n=1 Tax=Phanerochaete sordida TaxID=48140 RepID=A0A9P3GHH7_9APHY|nr:hypothetical protein PsYK624_099410 [Phanerochaete sordida]
MPLSVRGEVNSASGPRFQALTEVLRRLPRIQALWLRHDRYALDESTLYWVFFNSKAPLLASVRIEMTSRYGYEPCELLELPWSTAPLKHLELQRFRQNDRLNMCLRPTLTHLRLLSPLQSWGTKSMKQLCQCLREMSLLQELHIADFKSARYIPWGSILCDTVFLPSLSDLRVEAQPELCQCLLRTLDFPSSARLSLIHDWTIEDEDTLGEFNVEQVDDLITAYTSKIIRAEAHDASLVSTLSLRTRYVPGPRTLSYSRFRLLFEVWPASDRAIFNFSPPRKPTFHLETWLPDADFLLRRICSTLYLPGVRALFVDDMQVPRAAWTAALASLPQLAALCAVGFAADELPAALRPRADPATGSTLLCPALERLVLRDAVWQPYFGQGLCGLCASQVRHGGTAACDASAAGALGARLVRCLAQRAVHGARLKKLKIVRAVNFGERERERLEAVVDELLWDGVELVRAPEDGTDSSESDEDLVWISDWSTSHRTFSSDSRSASAESTYGTSSEDDEESSDSD